MNDAPKTDSASRMASTLPPPAPCGVQYSAKVDAVIYGCPATGGFTREDWIALARAAIDQASTRDDLGTVREIDDLLSSMLEDES